MFSFTHHRQIKIKRTITCTKSIKGVFVVTGDVGRWAKWGQIERAALGLGNSRWVLLRAGDTKLLYYPQETLRRQGGDNTWVHCYIMLEPEEKNVVVKGSRNWPRHNWYLSVCVLFWLIGEEDLIRIES